MSVDLLAEDAATYEMVTGEGGFEVAKGELVALVEAPFTVKSLTTMQTSRPLIFA